jgi:hypothetical protein
MRNLSLQNKHFIFKLSDINGKRNSALISPFRGAPFNNSGQIMELKGLKALSPTLPFYALLPLYAVLT